MRIWRGYLPWGFCISNQIIFHIRENLQTFFICEQNFFICEIFFINSVSSSDCRGSYGPLYQTILYNNYFKVNARL